MYSCFTGNEYSAIVELAPYQKVPRRKPKKVDVKMGSIEQGRATHGNTSYFYVPFMGIMFSGLFVRLSVCPASGLSVWSR